MVKTHQRAKMSHPSLSTDPERHTCPTQHGNFSKANEQLGELVPSSPTTLNHWQGHSCRPHRALFPPWTALPFPALTTIRTLLQVVKHPGGIWVGTCVFHPGRVPAQNTAARWLCGACREVRTRGECAFVGPWSLGDHLESPLNWGAVSLMVRAGCFQRKGPFTTVNPPPPT